MTTPLMNLNLPTPTVTLGPTWATQLNDALTNGVDSHDHSPGKGALIPTAGLNINDDLSFNSHTAFGLASIKLNSTALLSTFTGVAHALSVFSYGGNLYYTNSAGNTVQITSGGSVVTPPGANVNTFSYNSITTNTLLTVAASAPTDYPMQAVNSTSASITVTLPSAGVAGAGRFYIVSDYSGNSETYPISIARSGSDTINFIASDLIIESDLASVMLVSDGVSNWSAV